MPQAYGTPAGGPLGLRPPKFSVLVQDTSLSFGYLESLVKADNNERKTIWGERHLDPAAGFRTMVWAAPGLWVVSISQVPL